MKNGRRERECPDLLGVLGNDQNRIKCLSFVVAPLVARKAGHLMRAHRLVRNAGGFLQKLLSSTYRQVGRVLQHAR